MFPRLAPKPAVNNHFPGWLATRWTTLNSLALGICDRRCKKIVKPETPGEIYQISVSGRNDPSGLSGGRAAHTARTDIEAKGWRPWVGARKADGPLHPQSYYNRSSESLLKRVYTGLGVDSGRPSWSLVSANSAPSFVPSLQRVVRLCTRVPSTRRTAVCEWPGPHANTSAPVMPI